MTATPARRALVVGGSGLTQVGQSLAAARVPGWDVSLLDTAAASAGPRALRALAWRFDRRPPRLAAFSRFVVDAVRKAGADTVVTTGAAPIRAADLAALGRLGVRRVNVSTDDPWNPRQRAGWFLRALPHYDAVFTPRRANEAELRALGVPHVVWLPFGYDPAHCVGPEPDDVDRARLACDVLFVGGADADRAPFIHALVGARLDVGVYGGYWSRWALPTGVDRGHADPETIRRATLASRVALVLVRRANRDGHTMRSVEAAAIGACLLAEDTPDHRALYGDAAAYFSTEAEMVERTRALVGDPGRRGLLAAVVRERVQTGGHTYVDRLRSILAP